MGGPGSPARDGDVVDRVWTLPNVLTAARLAAIPLFLWLLLSGHPGWALLVLVASSLTDYLDGALARRFHLVSRLGQILDPLADRLSILAALAGLWLYGLVPTWFVLALLLRDVVGTVLVGAVRRVGYRTLPVHLVGKAGTFALLVAFPLLLAAEWVADTGGPTAAATVALAGGWAFAWWGLGLYWAAGLLYVLHSSRLIRAARSPRAAS